MFQQNTTSKVKRITLQPFSLVLYCLFQYWFESEVDLFLEQYPQMGSIIPIMKHIKKKLGHSHIPGQKLYHSCLKITININLPQLIIFLGDREGDHFYQFQVHPISKDCTMYLQSPKYKHWIQYISTNLIPEIKGSATTTFHQTCLPENCMLPVKPITTIQSYKKLTPIDRCTSCALRSGRRSVLDGSRRHGQDPARVVS